MSKTAEPSQGLSSAGDITRIALLALLSRQAMHGYEVRRTMERYEMHRWADIRYSSIYAGLRQLTKEGLLTAAGTERAGNRPPRTVYHITMRGRDELHRLIRRTWMEPAFSAQPVDVALSFFTLLPMPELIALATARLDALDAYLAQFDTVRRAKAGEEIAPDADRYPKREDLPPYIHAMVTDIFAHHRLLLVAEREWTTHVLARMRSGVYDHPDSVERTDEDPGQSAAVSATARDE